MSYRIVTRKGALINGRTGWDWEIWDESTGKIKTQGWSAGKRADAESDAREWVRRNKEREAKQEQARLRGGIRS